MNVVFRSSCRRRIQSCLDAASDRLSVMLPGSPPAADGGRQGAAPSTAAAAIAAPGAAAAAAPAPPAEQPKKVVPWVNVRFARSASAPSAGASQPSSRARLSSVSAADAVRKALTADEPQPPPQQPVVEQRSGGGGGEDAAANAAPPAAAENSGQGSTQQQDDAYLRGRLRDVVERMEHAVTRLHEFRDRWGRHRRLRRDQL